MNFYYANSERQAVGPISETQLHELARGSQIQMETPIIREGQTEWQPYKSIAPTQRYLPPPVPPQLVFQPASQAPPPVKSSGILKKGCLGIVGIFAFFAIGVPILSSIFSGVSKVNENTTKSTPVSAKAGEKPVETNQLKIGQKFKLGNFSYVITKVFRTTHIAESDADGAFLTEFSSQMNAKIGAKANDDDGSFLVVRYKIKNEGTESDVVSTTDFSIRDSKNRTFKTSSEATEAIVNLQGADFLLTELQPGISREGVQAFTLPNEAFDGKLTLCVPEKSLFSSNEVYVNLDL